MESASGATDGDPGRQGCRVPSLPELSGKDSDFQVCSSRPRLPRLRWGAIRPKEKDGLSRDPATKNEGFNRPAS